MTRLLAPDRWEVAGVDVPSLPGREEVLATVATAMSALLGGQGGAFVVDAPHGFGKSEVLRQTVRLAERQGLRVAHGRASPLDEQAPLSTIVTSLGGDGTVGRWPADADGAAHPIVMINKLASRLEEIAWSDPLVVVIDDVHDADQLSALALRMLVPSLADVPVLWVLGRRPSPGEGKAGHDAVETLVEYGVPRFELGGISPAGVEQLCRAVLGAPPGPRLADVAARAGGHPFLLLEVLSGLRDQGRLHCLDGHVELGATDTATPLPPTFVTAVFAELSRHSRPAREVLDAGAVLHRPFTLHEVAAVLGRSVCGLVAAATEVVNAGRLVEGDQGLSFAQPLVREAWYASMSGAVRQALHREAAQAVEAEGRADIEVVAHLIRGGEGSRRQAAEVVRRAVTGPRARDGAAAGLAGELLGRFDHGDRRLLGLLADLVALVAEDGRADEARRLADRVIHHLAPGTAAVALLRELAARVRTRRAAWWMDHTCGQVGARDDIGSADRAWLLAQSARARVAVGSFAAAERPARDALDLADTDDGLVADASLAGSAAAMACGDLTRARELVGRGADARRARPTGPPGGHARVWAAPVLLATDRVDEARTALQPPGEADEPALERALRRGTRAMLQLATGRLDAAAAEAEAGLGAERDDGGDLDAVCLRAVAGEAALRRGRVEVAVHHLEQGGLLMLRDERRAVPLAWLQILIEESRGRPHAALRVIAHLIERPGDRTALLLARPEAGPVLVRLLLRGGRRDEAEQVLETIRALCAGQPDSTSWAAAVAHATGLWRDRGDALRHAAELACGGPRPFLAAAAAEDAGRHARSHGDVAGGRVLLAEAAQRWSDTGAVADADRVRSLAREAPDVPANPAPPGSSPVSAIPPVIHQAHHRVRARAHDKPREKPHDRTPAPVPVDDRADPTALVDDGPAGWAELTPAEIRVVELVVQGMTNREVAATLVVSPHTVDSHLRHSYSKLGVTSRVELTRLLLSGPPAPDPAKT